MIVKIVQQRHGLALKLNMTHLNLWERQHGKIPHGAFVILRSGWDEYYGKRDKFFGLFDDEENQVFPGKVKYLISFETDHIFSQKPNSEFFVFCFQN